MSTAGNRRAVARTPSWLVDATLVAISLADVALNIGPDDPILISLAVLGCLALLARRRFPVATFLATLPLAATQELALAPLLALLSLSAQAGRRWVPWAGLALYTAAAGPSWEFSTDRASAGDTVVTLVYTATTGAAALLLGRLIRTRGELLRRLDDIERSEQHERELYAQTVVAEERVRLAREMHDVVSHQVGLVAVQAGALQVSTRDPGARDIARTIRGLCVTTLDELRSMVLLLRTPGSEQAETRPQPTLADLPELVGATETAYLVGGIRSDVDLPTQRAIYRTVQEALTNARKWAPSARVEVALAEDDEVVGVTIRNEASAHPPLGLPSAGHGLVGLRERAESLGGLFSAGPAGGGGWELRVSLPRRGV